MENQPNNLGSMFKNAGDYLETRLELLKLQAVNKTSEVASSIVAGITIVILVLFIVLLVNIGLALWIGDLVGKSYLGFLIVAGFYAIIALLIHFFQRSWIKDPISSMLIKKFLN